MALHRLIHNFLLVVVTHRRTREMPAIRRSFEAAVDERLGWVPAEIASAKDLSDEQKKASRDFASNASSANRFERIIR